MFEHAFKRIDQILHTDSGSATELDYVEQTSWILFLKYLDDLEETKKTEAALAGKKYTYILDKQYQWDTWAAPKTSEGKIDHQKALDGDDLKDFVNDKLFPYLRKFRSEEPNTIEYKIGEIFSELKNKISSGYKLREILNIVDGMHFQRYEEKHELSHLYEDKIKNMGNAGRNGGEYYTPRPLIKTIVEVVDPQIGEKIYDGACGSAGFLVEAYDYLTQNQAKLTSSQLATLQNKTFYGKEIKSLAYIIGIMNMILHGIEAPNIKHTNTLAQNINDIQEKDRYDVILANPPFGAGIGQEIQQNFPIKTGETALLFMQHYIKRLKAGGRAGIVIKNTFLSNMDGASISLRKHLLETCNLHTILELPGGAFAGAGVKTVVLFFEKGKSTQKVWFYQPNLNRNLGKTDPLNENDLKEFIELQKTFAESKNSWSLKIQNLDQSKLDLSVKNPNRNGRAVLRDSKAILAEIKKLDNDSEKILNSLQNEKNIFEDPKEDWRQAKLGDVCNIIGGGTPSRANKGFWGGNIPWATVADMKSEIITETLEKITDKAIEDSATNIIPKGNVIIATRVGLGKVCLTEIDTAINQDLKGVIPKNSKDLLPEYLFQWLKSVAHLIKEEGTGATVQGVKLPFIKSLLIPIPKSVSRQRLIVKRLIQLSANAQRLRDIYDRKIACIAELKESTLHSALTPSPYIRNQVHAAIISQLMKDGGESTEVAVAKYDHLLQEVYGLPLGYHFQAQQFGPFDAEIKRLLYSGLGRNKWFAKRGGMIVLGSNARALLSKQSNLYRSASSAMTNLAELGITKRDVNSVELLSTVCHAIKETGSTAVEGVRDLMSRWPTDQNRTKAEKFSLGRTQKCLDFILQHNLHVKLLS